MTSVDLFFMVDLLLQILKQTWDQNNVPLSREIFNQFSHKIYENQIACTLSPCSVSFLTLLSKHLKAFQQFMILFNRYIIILQFLG